MSGSCRLVSSVPILRAAELRSLGGRPAAVGAFNVNFYTQAEGILEGLRRADAPGLIQASRGACKFQGGPNIIRDMLLAAMEESGHHLPVSLHLDHGDEEAAASCIENGFSSVMIDGSKFDYADNIALTKRIVAKAHPKGISVEGEYGKLEGVEEDVVHEKTTYADPLLVPNFFAKSGADMLAVAYGTSHGPNKGADIAKVNIGVVDRSYRGLVAYRQNLDHFLVGHGSSTVPKDMVEEINRYGGAIKDAHGVPMEKIKEAIACGIRKVNIDTDLRLGITAVFRKWFNDHPGVEKKHPVLKAIKDVLDRERSAIDPRTYLDPVDREMLRVNPAGTPLEDVMALVKERVAAHVEMLVHEFGSAGLAGYVEPVSLETMAQRYSG